MSVFVNLNRFASDVNKQSLEFLSLGGTGAIVDNPSKYQVGVDRFKIPLSSIPLYRIYENELYFGFSPFNKNRYKGSRLPNYDHSINRTTIFDGEDVFTNKGRYGIDKLNDNKKFIDIYSQEEFVDLLNKGVQRSFNALSYSQYNKWVDATTTTLLWDNSKDVTIGGEGEATVNGTQFNQGGANAGGKATPISGATNYTTTDGITVVGMSPINQKNNDGTARTAVRSVNMSATEFVTQTQTADASYVGQLITGVRLNVKSFTRPNNGTTYVDGGVASGKSPNFADFRFYLEQYDKNLGTTPDYYDNIDPLNVYYFNTAVLDGKQEWDFIPKEGVPTELRVGEQPFIDDGSFVIGDKYGVAFGTGEHFQLEPRDNFDLQMNDAFTKGYKGTDTFHLRLEENEAKSIIGQRYDGFTYRLCVENKTYVNDPANSSTGYCVAGGLEVQFNTIPLNFITKKYQDQPPPATSLENDTISYYVPRFQLNDDGRIQLVSKPLYNNQMELSFYMNHKLANLMSFDSYKRHDIENKTDLLRYFALIDDDFADLDRGSIFSFNSKLGNMNDTLSALKDKNDFYIYKEAFNTGFNRDWLNSIVITTGISIAGELVGGGDSKRKVLTDFEIDPASVKRDYLIFTNSGGERFYPLLTEQPLREINLQVNFQDIFGKNRRLTLLSGQECSIKLEFRPNNQLFNFPSSVSSFDIN